MSRNSNNRIRGPLLGLTALGMLPAFIILLFLRLEEGQLVIAGQAIGEYNMARLTAGLWSVTAPVFLLAPLAMAHGRKVRGLDFWLIPACVPWMLTAPSLIAGWLVGGDAPVQIFPALLLLALMLLSWTLWVGALNTLVTFRTSVLIYGVLWAASGFIGYLHDYIVPNLDLGVSGLIKLLYWCLPGLQNGLDALDTYLATGELRPGILGLILVQIAVLATFILVADRKQKSGEEPRDAS